MTVFQILEKIYLDKNTGNYEKIFILNNKPNDVNLTQYIKQIPRNKLSPFDNFYNNEQHCFYAFIDPRNNYSFLNQNDIDLLINILTDSGYKIEYNMMKLLKNNKKNDIFCFISK
jgi:hypothetical protein|uniref:Uncharacterized protein n=1 Tax=viral metagenome TaxID=1070528 RepID=A0A6C0C5I9_9ZZZZ